MSNTYCDDPKSKHEEAGVFYLPVSNLSEDDLPRPVVQQTPPKSTLRKWGARALWTTATCLVVGDLLRRGTHYYHSQGRKHVGLYVPHEDYPTSFGVDVDPHHPDHPHHDHPHAHPVCKIWIPEGHEPAPDSRSFNTEDDEKTHLSYELDLGTALTAIGSRGPFNGHINFVRDKEERDTVIVDVELPKGKFVDNPHRKPEEGDHDHHRSSHHKKRGCPGKDHPPHPPFVRICKWQDEDGNTFGLTLGNGPGRHHHHVPGRRPPPRDMIRYDPSGPHPHFGAFPVKMTVHLPAGHVYFSHFKAKLGGFALTIDDDVLENVEFDKVELATAFGPISVKGLNAQIAAVATTNAEINGTYTATKSLTLATNNAPINANVTLIDTDEGSPSTLTLANSHAHITSFINLKAAPGDDDEAHFSEAAFRVTAASTDGALNVHVLEQPVDSNLQLTAATKNAPIDVSLAPAFEGSFSLVTTRSNKALVKADRDVEDPAGKGRERVVNVKNLFGFITGDVQWVDKGEGKIDWPRWGDKNKVTLATSNGDIVMSL